VLGFLDKLVGVKTWNVYVSGRISNTVLSHFNFFRISKQKKYYLFFFFDVVLDDFSATAAEMRVCLEE
jgi:hypothetical protein